VARAKVLYVRVHSGGLCSFVLVADIHLAMSIGKIPEYLVDYKRQRSTRTLPHYPMDERKNIVLPSLHPDERVSGRDLQRSRRSYICTVPRHTPASARSLEPGLLLWMAPVC
jgi:hypothetical protein